jgi:hypothetical protein
MIGIGSPGSYYTSIVAPTTGTTFKALGPGATITQTAAAGSQLIVAPNTVIELGGNDRAAGGEIILKESSDTGTPYSNSAQLILANATSKITTRNTSAGQSSAVVVATDFTTTAAGTSITAIGLPYLAGDGTNAKATPTVTATDGKVPPRRLISLEGTSAATIVGGDGTATVDEEYAGRISSLTPTVELQ